MGRITPMCECGRGRKERTGDPLSGCRDCNIIDRVSSRRPASAEVVHLLRGGGHTTLQVATALGVAHNTAQQLLGRLRRDGVVERRLVDCEEGGEFMRRGRKYYCRPTTHAWWTLK